MYEITGGAVWMSFINDFTLSSIQYLAVKFKRNSVRSQQTAMCSSRMLDYEQSLFPLRDSRVEGQKQASQRVRQSAAALKRDAHVKPLV